MPTIPEPFTLVIFGATGDLAHRKLIPAVFNLFRQGLLPDDVSVIGFARRDKTDEGFREELLASLRQYSPEAFDREAWDRFAPRITYHRAAFEDAEGFRSHRREPPPRVVCTRRCGPELACSSSAASMRARRERTVPVTTQ